MSFGKFLASDNYLSSYNENLDVLTVIFIGIAGIVIKLFFTSNKTIDGNNGPANSNIWGDSLTALSLFLLIFIVYGNNSDTNSKSFTDTTIESNAKSTGIITLLISVAPIFITLILIMYSIFINLTFMTNINKLNGTDESYGIYNNISNFMLIIQISIIFKYVYEIINNSTRKDKTLTNISLGSYFIGVLNLCLLLIINIILYFYSLNG